MNRKIIASLTAVIALLLAVVIYLGISLGQEKQVTQDMKELAALEKVEMESEYQEFANQYGEMRQRINNDSIVAQLTREQQRTQQLLEELRKTKAEDAAAITRLKKELATVRAVMRGYVLQIDSLDRMNRALMTENDRVRSELELSNQQNMELSSSNQSLSEKVAKASQLNATSITLTPQKANDKAVKYMKKAKKLAVGFVVARNVTAASGNRDFYVRITTPQGAVLDGGGTFSYDNRQQPFTMKKSLAFSGEETAVTMAWTVKDALVGGTYNVSIFADGKMIGSKNFTFEK